MFNDDAGATPVLTVNTPPLCIQTCNVTLKVTDLAGALTSCSSSVTITDGTAPGLSVPANVTTECDADSSPAGTGQATATDNCDGSPSVSFSDSVTPGLCPDESTITRTWTSTDACGNSASVDQIILIADTTMPTVTCPADTAVQLPASTDPSATGEATATDNCDGAPSVTSGDVESAPVQYCPTVTEITRTWTATDACGNAISCDQNIEVTDPPVPSGQCCNPANGALTPIDEGDECTTDICDSLTGQVAHPDNGLCGACCLVGKDCVDRVLEGTCGGIGGTFLGEQTGCLGDSDGDGIDDQCDSCRGVDDAIFGVSVCSDTGLLCERDDDCARGEVCEKACIGKIPTVSGWGLIVLSLLLLTAGKVYFGYRDRRLAGA